MRYLRQASLRFKFENRNEVRSIDQSLVFGPFTVAEATFICSFGEDRDTRPNGWIDSKRNSPGERILRRGTSSAAQAVRQARSLHPCPYASRVSTALRDRTG